MKANSKQAVNAEDLKYPGYCRICKKTGIMMTPMRFEDRTNGQTEYGTICPVCGTRLNSSNLFDTTKKKFLLAISVLPLIGMIIGTLYFIFYIPFSFLYQIDSNTLIYTMILFIITYIFLFLLIVFFRNELKKSQRLKDFADRNFIKNN